MKQIFILFSLAIFISSCGGSGNSTPAEGASIDLSGFEILDIPGTTFQKVVKRTPAGILLEEGTLSNGKRNGMWVTYHASNEIPKTIINYVNDVNSGVIPMDKLSRTYIDTTGIIGQKIAKISDEVYEVKLGLSLQVK